MSSPACADGYDTPSQAESQQREDSTTFMVAKVSSLAAGSKPRCRQDAQRRRRRSRRPRRRSKYPAPAVQVSTPRRRSVPAPPTCTPGPIANSPRTVRCPASSRRCRRLRGVSCFLLACVRDWRRGVRGASPASGAAGGVRRHGVRPVLDAQLPVRPLPDPYPFLRLKTP